MTREELYQEAKAKRKEEKNKPKGGYGNFPRPEWFPLNTTYSQVRFVGNYPTGRHGDPTAAKFVEVAMIVGDDGKKFRCIFPDQREHKDWIMWRILNKVGAYTYNRETKTRSYKNQGSPCLRQILTNGNETSSYESGWYPKRVLVVNVIAREEMEWHRANKKLMLLSKKMTPSKREGDEPFYELGIPASTYQTLIDEVVESSGDWEMYDVLMKRLTEKPYYKVLHATDDLKKFRDELSTFTYFENFASAPLTQEELSWERWNIDEMFPITTYTKLNNHLAIWIKKIDAEFGTNFATELAELAAEEAAEWAKNEANNPSSSNTDDEEDSDDSAQEASASAMEEAVSGSPTPYSALTSVGSAPVSRVSATTPVTRRSVAPAGVNWVKIAETHPGVAALTEEEKACVASVNPDGTFVYKVPQGVNPNVICEDETNCGFIAPDSFHVCPKCALIFGSDGKYADLPF